MFSMPTRARSPYKRNAERKFPVRIRIMLPDGGSGTLYDAIHEWLHHEMGQNGYAWTSDTIPGHYASAIYLPNVEVAHRLVEQFDLELLFIEEIKLI